MDVRVEILRTATRLFAAHGFDGTSLQNICDAVGVRKASLLYHFGSKDELRQSVLAEVLDRWNDILPQLMLAASTGEQRFGDVIGETASFFAADPDRARLLLREILDRPEDMRVRLESRVRPWVDMLADMIRRGQQHGDIYEQVDPEAYVLQVVNLVVSGVAIAASLGGALLPTGGPGPAPAKRHARELIRIARYSLFRTPHDGLAAVGHVAPHLRASDADADRSERSAGDDGQTDNATGAGSSRP